MVVATADRLSKLRLLTDHGAWHDGDAAAGMPDRLKQCFDNLTLKNEN
jgi:hypothetical protein